MIGIVVSNDLNTCPYIDKYLDILNKRKIPYEIILWNRDGRKRDYPDNYIIYDCPSELYVPKRKKIKDFAKFTYFLNRTIRRRKYDKLIFLTTFTALMCYTYTCGKYKKKYIFDFRDLSLEHNRIFRGIVKKVIDNSYFTCMSSPEFAKVFGVTDYVIAHNFRYRDLAENCLEIQERGKNGIINLLHIGITRGEEYNKRLADVFGNDKRFEVNIIGSGNDTPSYLEYTKSIPNITVKGTYDNEEKAKLIESADMLLYYYPSSFNCDRALANKYYDGLIYKKPLVGNVNTYSGKRLYEKGLGISLDLSSDTFASDVFTYYMNFDWVKYAEAVEKEINAVLSEDKIYVDRIEEFVSGE